MNRYDNTEFIPLNIIEDKQIINYFIKQIRDKDGDNYKNFSINKCTTMIIRSETLLFNNKKEPIFYFAGQLIPKIEFFLINHS